MVEAGQGTGPAGGPPTDGGGAGQVQCATCHDPHLRETDATKGPQKFLRGQRFQVEHLLALHHGELADTLGQGRARTEALGKAGGDAFAQQAAPGRGRRARPGLRGRPRLNAVRCCSVVLRGASIMMSVASKSAPRVVTARLAARTAVRRPPARKSIARH